MSEKTVIADHGHQLMLKSGSQVLDGMLDRKKEDRGWQKRSLFWLDEITGLSERDRQNRWIASATKHDKYQVCDGVV